MSEGKNPPLCLLSSWQNLVCCVPAPHLSSNLHSAGVPPPAGGEGRLHFNQIQPQLPRRDSNPGKWLTAGGESSQQPAPPPAGGTGRWHVRAATVPPPPLPLFSTPRTRHFRWRFGEHNITWNFHKVNLNPFLSESNTNKLLILLNN